MCAGLRDWSLEKKTMPRPYEQYLLQTGSGLADLGQIYRGNSFGAYQRGRGLGDVFGSVYRFLKPYLASGVRAVSGEMARGGAEVLGNLGTRPIGELLREQSDKSLQNLASKASDKLNRLAIGRGLKRRKFSFDDVDEDDGSAPNLTGGRRGIKRRRMSTKTRRRQPAKRGRRNVRRNAPTSRSTRKGLVSNTSTAALFGGRVVKKRSPRGKRRKTRISGPKRRAKKPKAVASAFLKQFLRRP